MSFDGLIVKESGAQTVLTLAETKLQLRVLDQFDDANISACMESAVAYVENFIWQSLRPQTLVASYTPDGTGFAELFRAAFDELLSVKYYDADGALQTLDLSSVSVDDSLFVPRAYFAEPKTDPARFGAVTITYKTRATQPISAQIKQAALVATAQFYDDLDNPDLTAVDNLLPPIATRYLL